MVLGGKRLDLVSGHASGFCNSGDGNFVFAPRTENGPPDGGVWCVHGGS
jgi:hypothetical protein